MVGLRDDSPAPRPFLLSLTSLLSLLTRLNRRMAAGRGRRRVEAGEGTVWRGRAGGEYGCRRYGGLPRPAHAGGDGLGDSEGARRGMDGGGGMGERNQAPNGSRTTGSPGGRGRRTTHADAPHAHASTALPMPRALLARGPGFRRCVRPDKLARTKQLRWDQAKLRWGKWGVACGVGLGQPYAIWMCNSNSCGDPGGRRPAIL